MHVYAIDEDRKSVLIFLVAVSIGIAYLISKIVGCCGANSIWWIDIPAPISVYGVMYWWFNNWGWSNKLFRRVGMVRTPNLNGYWQAEMRSSYDEFKTLYRAETVIKQNWTSISIMMNRDSSSSHSIAASLNVNTTAKTKLSYLYMNEPKPESVQTMSIHNGTAVLLLSEDGDRLEGEYYTGRGRSTHGSLILSKTTGLPVVENVAVMP